MGGNYNERSDAASPNSSSSSSNKGSSSPSVSSAVTLKPIPLVVKTPPVTRKVGRASPPLSGKQRYTYRVLQTIQMKLILLCVWQSRPFWAALKLLQNSNMKFK